MIIIRDVPGPVQWYNATDETRPDRQTGKGSNVPIGIIITVGLLICLLTGTWL